MLKSDKQNRTPAIPQETNIPLLELTFEKVEQI